MYFPLCKLTKSEPFIDAQCIAGAEGLSRIVEGIDYVNTSTGCQFLSERYLLILGANEWYIEECEQELLLKSVINSGVSGIVFYNSVGSEIPDNIIKAAEEHQIAIFLAGDMIKKFNYCEIMDYFFENFYIASSDRFISKDYILKKFYSCNEDDEIGCILDKLWCYSGLEVYAKYKGESYCLGNKEHVNNVISRINQCVRIETKGVFDKDAINTYKLKCDLGEYYCLATSLGALQSEDYFILISRGDNFNIQNLKLFYFAFLALEVNNKKKLGDFYERHAEILNLLIAEEVEEGVILEEIRKKNFIFDNVNLVVLFSKIIDKLVVSKLYNEIKALIESLGINYYTPLIGAYHDNTILILPAVFSDAKNMESLFSIIEKVAAKQGVIYSGYTRIELWRNFSIALKQAKKALFWSSIRKNRSVLDYQQLGALKYVGEKEAVGYLGNLESSSIGHIMRYDRDNNTDLFRSLQAYLKNLGSFSKASRELFLSINTVKYKICQVEKILDLELNKMENRLLLELELNIYNIRNENTIC